MKRQIVRMMILTFVLLVLTGCAPLDTYFLLSEKDGVSSKTASIASGIDGTGTSDNEEETDTEEEFANDPETAGVTIASLIKESGEDGTSD